MKRLLLLSPVVDRHFVGGLQLALEDLKRELERLGWSVDAPLYREAGDTLAASILPAAGWIAAIQRSPFLLRLRARIPASLRLTLSSLAAGQGEAQASQRNLRWAEERLREPGRYDAVVVCVDQNVRGMLALAMALHPRVAVLSLGALTGELRPSLWWLARLRRVHPYYYRSVKTHQIRCAIFASDRWKDEAVEAGLPAAVAHTIFFGIRVGARPSPRPPARGRRLLWVGRLTPEKGLHLLLQAMPALRERCPGITLTAVAAQGEATYRQLIEHLIDARGLRDAVELRAAVPREQLPALYAGHDALFFYSVNREPVALVLMEAFASGLAVAANQAATGLVEEGVTCLTYDATNPDSLAGTLERLLADGDLRNRLTASARRRVEDEFSLEAMGAAWDRLLRGLRDHSG